jgi:hypothetical protein
MLSNDDFAVLNAIHLKKMASAETIVDATGLAREVVDARLLAASEAGLVLTMPTGAMLLEDGTAQVLATYGEAYEAARTDPALAQWYEHFEALNTRFIAQVSEWQQTDGDERVERKLLQSAERLVRDIRSLLPSVPRYARYIARFEHAMDLVDQGQRDYVCKPTLDSVHNIWFEFHEDILTVIGRPRDVAEQTG